MHTNPTDTAAHAHTQDDEDRQEDEMLLYQQTISIKTSIKPLFMLVFHCCQSVIQAVNVERAQAETAV